VFKMSNSYTKLSPVIGFTALYKYVYFLSNIAFIIGFIPQCVCFLFPLTGFLNTPYSLLLFPFVLFL